MFKSISLERTVCLGSCPIYKVVLFADGTVFWEGEAFVHCLGNHEWMISTNSVESIQQLLDRFDFRSFTYEPVLWMEDLPSCMITVEYMDDEIIVLDHPYGITEVDKHITTFEKALEYLIGTAPYVRSENKRRS
ncbi:DUF6438 domain-containing protein [Paenibacillus sp. FSL H8-0034]|uniref:DUF6438 domain-containing protein n=1 Tax=Paenibacillus sp. FSL H8-0034 TaxID=2954671 RepID=UPI0030FA7B97